MLLRTGDISSMNKYLRWEQCAIVFTVVRVVDQVTGVPQLAINGSMSCTDKSKAQVCNSYFTRYSELTAAVSQKEPLVMDDSWAPKRRRRELSDDGDSQAALTPMTFDATPVKFDTP